MIVSAPRPGLSLLLPALAAVLSVAAPAARAASAPRTDAIDDTVAAFFRPFQHEVATLSPDGRHVALSELLPGKPPAIVIINVDDRTTTTHPVDPTAEHAVRELRWVSPTRLVFTTRGRAVGALDLKTGAIEALLVRKDFEGFMPEPELGVRRYTAASTPDMSADSFARSSADVGPFQEVSLRDALAQARVSADVFSQDSRPTSARSLRPFLLGAKPGSPHVLQVELREDADLFAYRTGDRQEITVPGNVYLREAGTPEPASVADYGGRAPMIGERAAYNIDRRPPPLVVLELDAVKGRWREVTREEDWRRVWLDHQGRLRLALEQRGRDYRYVYRPADSKKWIPLDSVVKTGAPLGFAVTPGNLLGARSVPLGFDAGGEILLIATNVGRDTYGMRALHLGTGALESLEVGHERYDLIEPTALTAGDSIRFDPHTHALAGVRFAAARREAMWFDAGMAQLQAQLAKQLAPRRVELREWTPDRRRFLVETSAPGDPGGFYVVDAAAGKIIRCGDRAPWLTEEKRNPTHAFDFDHSDGRRIVGFLTRPRQPRLNPPPVLVYFHDGPWFAEAPQFNRGAQALASLGFAVLQLNHRGSSGLGRAHLAAIADGLDRAVLDDVRAVLERGQNGGLGINTRVVAAFGNGIGGYLAVRMAQLAPETFRCAVAINTPGDLDAWRTHPEVVRSVLTELRPHVFGTDRDKLRAQSALAAAPATRAPVLVVHGTSNTYVPYSMGQQLYRALKQGAEETAFLALENEGHGGWSEATTSKLFAELGRFFNATIYSYGVEVRQSEVVR